jgi:hypothetical protein
MVRRFFSPSFRRIAMDSKKRILIELNTKVKVTESNKKEKSRWNKSWQSLTFEDWHSCESTFLSMLSNIRKSILLKVPRLRSFVLLVTVVLKWKVWSIGGMSLTGQNLSTKRNTCPTTTFSTANFTGNGPKLNTGLRAEKPATNWPMLRFATHLHIQLQSPPHRDHSLLPLERPAG